MFWKGRRACYAWDKLQKAFEEAREGQEESREALFALLRSRLLVVARYRVPEIAEDIVHEALVVVHKRLSEFEVLENLLAFTHQALRNKVGNVYQQKYRHKHVTLEDTELVTESEPEFEAGELDRIVRQSIDKLGENRPVCRAILSCLYHGLEPDEISERLGMSKTRLKVRTFRCRQALRDLLFQEYQLEV